MFRKLVDNPQMLIFVCINCGKKTAQVWSDLGGKPFVDYYCETCKEIPENELNERR